MVTVWPRVRPPLPLALLVLLAVLVLRAQLGAAATVAHDTDNSNSESTTFCGAEPCVAPEVTMDAGEGIPRGQHNTQAQDPTHDAGDGTQGRTQRVSSSSWYRDSRPGFSGT